MVIILCKSFHLIVCSQSRKYIRLSLVYCRYVIYGQKPKGKTFSESEETAESEVPEVVAA